MKRLKNKEQLAFILVLMAIVLVSAFYLRKINSNPTDIVVDNREEMNTTPTFEDSVDEGRQQ